MILIIQSAQYGWVGVMTLPREFSFVNSKLFQKPISEIKSYFSNEQKEFPRIEGSTCALELKVDVRNSPIFELELRSNGHEKTILSYYSKNVLLEFNCKNSGHSITGLEEEHLYKREVYSDMTKDKLKLEIFIDRSSTETFINDGIDTMTANVYPKQVANKIKLRAKGTAEIINNNVEKMEH